MTVAALFVENGGVYFGRGDVDPWDEARDARTYAGPHPVVAHPPCHLWVNLAAVNWKRYRRQRPAWYEDGTDGGCFAAALASVRAWGGVLEHPAGSHAWTAFGLREPWSKRTGWRREPGDDGWVCEVWQSAYGHPARKRTWLYYRGDAPPAEMNWDRSPGTHQVGWFDRAKPTLGKKAASRTPPAFADALVALAENGNAPGRGR